METKICNTCKKKKELSEFNKNKARPDGYQHRCKECRTIHFKEDYIKNREVYLAKNNKRRQDWRDFIRSLKLKCEQCEEDHPWCLEFHHKDKNKKEISIVSITGSQVFSEKWKKIVLEEIKKCSVLCANCHRKEHSKEYFGA